MKKIEHETIVKAQKEISLPYSDCNPSEITDVYWIYATRKNGDYPKSTARSGKWLIFVDIKNVDVIWAKIISTEKT